MSGERSIGVESNEGPFNWFKVSLGAGEFAVRAADDNQALKSTLLYTDELRGARLNMDVGEGEPAIEVMDTAQSRSYETTWNEYKGSVRLLAFRENLSPLE